MHTRFFSSSLFFFDNPLVFTLFLLFFFSITPQTTYILGLEMLMQCARVCIYSYILIGWGITYGWSSTFFMFIEIYILFTYCRDSLMRNECSLFLYGTSSTIWVHGDYINVFLVSKKRLNWNQFGRVEIICVCVSNVTFSIFWFIYFPFCNMILIQENILMRLFRIPITVSNIKLIVEILSIFFQKKSIGSKSFW